VPFPHNASRGAEIIPLCGRTAQARSSLKMRIARHLLAAPGPAHGYEHQGRFGMSGAGNDVLATAS